MLPTAAYDPEVLNLLERCKERPEDQAPWLVLADKLEELGEDDFAACLRGRGFGSDGFQFSERDQKRWHPFRSFSRADGFSLVDDETTYGPACTAPELADCPWFFSLLLSQCNLPGLNEEELSQEEMFSGWLAYFNSAHVRHLTSLHLSEMSSECLAAVARSHGLTALRHMKLNRTGLAQGVGVRLAETILPTLESLDVTPDYDGRREIDSMLRAVTASPLRSLSFSYSESDDDTALAIARAPLTALRNISFVDGLFTHVGYETMFRSPIADTLKSVALYSCANARFALNALSATHRDMRIEELLIWGTYSRDSQAESSRIDDETFENFALSPQARYLRTLRLTQHGIGPAGVTALAAAGVMPNLTTLDLSHNRVDAQGVESLLASPLGETLRSLVVSNNPLGDEGIKKLAGWKNLVCMEQVNLASTQMTGTGFAALMRSPFLTRCHHLAVSDNPVGDDGWAGFADAELPALNSLHLPSCGIGPRGVQLLAAGRRRMKGLTLERNPLGDEGVAALAVGPVWDELAYLNIEYVGATESGLLALVESVAFPKLKSLRIGYGMDEVKAAFRASPNWKDCSVH